MDILLELVGWVIDHALMLGFIFLALIAACGMLYAAAGYVGDCLEDYEDDDE